MAATQEASPTVAAQGVTTSYSQLVSPSRTIVTLMAGATGAALISHEVKNPLTGTVGGARILLGFGFATVALIFLAKTGDPGEKFAKGLATITLVTSLLANGSDVATAVDRLVAAPTTVTKTTTATKATPAKVA